MSADFRSQVETQRAYLLRYAGMQLRNPDAAEDAVQETLLAALTAEASFGGRSCAARSKGSRSGRMTQSAEPADASGSTRCARCGSDFACGMAAGAPRCWCAELPPLQPMPGRACLCRNCLEEELKLQST